MPEGIEKPGYMALRAKHDTRPLEEKEAREAERWINEAVEMAKKATCEKAHCGAVVVKDGKIIGRGFNSPSGGDETQRRCSDDTAQYSGKVVDKTCCPHAEQRAIFDAVKNVGEEIKGADLYFARVDNKTGELKKSGEPYCTSCSRLAHDSSLGHFVLSQTDGIRAFKTGEYNNLSYETTRTAK